MSIDPRTIIEATEAAFRVPKGSVVGKNRSPRISEARAVSIYISRKLTEYSTTELGNWFFNKDHSSIVKATKKIDAVVSLKRRTDCYVAIENLLEQLNV